MNTDTLLLVGALILEKPAQFNAAFYEMLREFQLIEK
jgi:hypothetical protein